MKTRAEINSYQREWRSRNKDKVVASLAKPGVKEKRRAYYRARYERRKDQIKEERKGYSAQYRGRKPWKILLHSAQRRCAKSGKSFSLTDEWARETYTGHCALTGIAFDLSGGKKPGPKPLSPSIDRIDQALGYEPINCRFVLSCINSFRGIMSDQQMIEVAKALIDCDDCGTDHCRDTNAARNILRVGLDTLRRGALS